MDSQDDELLRDALWKYSIDKHIRDQLREQFARFPDECPSSLDCPSVVPPQAGEWIRRRYLPRPATHRRGNPRLEPEWDGAWHVASGDMAWQPGWGGAHPRAMCGYLLGTPSSFSELVRLPVGETPAVDACRRCAKRAEHDLIAEPELLEAK